MRHLLLLLPLFIAGTANSDIGLLGSVAQNPVPVSATAIEMTAEDVLIEIYPDGMAELTALFLFTNAGPADTVLMYFPITVRTSVNGAILPLSGVSDPLENPRVTVNGADVTVRPLIGNSWHPQFEDYTWEETVSVVDMLSPAEPDTGSDYYYIPNPELWDSYDLDEIYSRSWDEVSHAEELVLLINSLNACWEVPFSEGESVIVEYSIEYEMSREYVCPYYTMIYPLYTGASWAGSIGDGRITVIPAGEMNFANFDSWSSVSMPEASIVSDVIFEPSSPMLLSDHLESTELHSRYGMHIDSALVWEFSDFEPVVSLTVWQNFYYSPDVPSGRLTSSSIGIDSVDWSSSIRVDVLSP